MRAGLNGGLDLLTRQRRIGALFIRELRSKAQQLGTMPLAFPLVPRYEHYGIRRRPFYAYLIFYRVEKEQVFIVHILHGARDYESLLFPAE